VAVTKLLLITYGSGLQPVGRGPTWGRLNFFRGRCNSPSACCFSTS